MSEPEQPSAPAPEPPGAAAPPAGAGAAATGAGRGVLYIAFAKFYFMFGGLFVQIRLPNLLSRISFGSYSLVASIASFVNNVLVTGTIQAVSRFSAQEPGKARLVQHAGLRMHVRVGLPIAIGFIAAAPIVSAFLIDSSKTAPLMLAGLICAGYSFYAVFVGTANGLREFHKQAGLDITFTTLRVAGLIGMAMAGLGVIGVIGGWVAAVAIILVASIVWVGLPKGVGAGERLPVKPLIRYFASVATYLTLFNALMFVDSLLIKRFTTIYFQDHIIDLVDSVSNTLPWAFDTAGYTPKPSELADVQNAYYAAVQNLARLSYQAIIAATFVVFPLVSKSTFSEDRETTRRYVEVTARYSLMFAMAIAVVMAANPVDVLSLVYAPDYAQTGAPALVWLAFGNVAFSVFAINGTILNGAGLTRPAIGVAALTVALAAAGNWIAIPIAAEHGSVLPVAAAVTSGAMAIGAVASAVVLRRRLGGGMPLLSLARIAVATVAAFAVGRLLPLGTITPDGALWTVAHRSKPMTLVAAVAVGVTFLVVLVATRELGARDLAAIKAVRKKRAAGGGEP